MKKYINLSQEVWEKLDELRGGSTRSAWISDMVKRTEVMEAWIREMWEREEVACVESGKVIWGNTREKQNESK